MRGLNDVNHLDDHDLLLDVVVWPEQLAQGLLGFLGFVLVEKLR